jgi:glycerol uptake operon antiterminator
LDTATVIQTICRERVIAAVADLRDVSLALESPVSTIFMLHARIKELGQATNLLRAHGKTVFIHYDMVEGLAPTAAGLELLLGLCPFDGVITTRGSIIQKGRKLGLVTVQRVFMIDSRSIATAVHAVEKYRPDAIEIMPGLMPKAVQAIHNRISPLIITGGMISTPQEVDAMLATPAAAISASEVSLWSRLPSGGE